MNRQLIRPSTAGGNQLFTPISEEIREIYGDAVLPIIPKTLVQP